MIKEYLPRKTKEMVLIQGLVPKDLLDQVKELKKATGWTWDELLTAFCKDLLKEFGNEKDSNL